MARTRSSTQAQTTQSRSKPTSSTPNPTGAKKSTTSRVTEPAQKPKPKPRAGPKRKKSTGTTSTTTTDSAPPAPVPAPLASPITTPPVTDKPGYISHTSQCYRIDRPIISATNSFPSIPSHTYMHPVLNATDPSRGPHVLYTHGAGGTLHAPAVENFCTGWSSVSRTRLVAFQGSSNLKARVELFERVWNHELGVREGEEEGKDARLANEAVKGRGDATPVFAGRSMGARAAVMAATRICGEGAVGGLGEGGKGARCICVSYPLKGPKDVRDQILVDLPAEFEVLFVVGDRDAMCPLEMLEEVRGRMKARSWVVVVKGADHGMNVKPAARTRSVGEETGMVAAGWVDGSLGKWEEEVVYIGDE